MKRKNTFKTLQICQFGKTYVSNLLSGRRHRDRVFCCKFFFGRFRTALQSLKKCL